MAKKKTKKVKLDALEIGDIKGGSAGETNTPMLDEEKADLEENIGNQPPLSSSDKGAVVPFDPLQRYMADMRRYPLISVEEEHELAVRYHEDADVDAAHKLVTSNLRLVVKIAMDYRKYWMNLLDLVQEGNVGLMQAVKHYDPYRGVKLSSYSSFWIKAYILKFIIDNWSLVKIGTTQGRRKLFYNLRKEKEKYALLGHDPEPEKIAKDLNVKPELVVEMDQRMSGGDLSLDQPVAKDSSDRHIDFLADRQKEIDDQLADAEIREVFGGKLREFRERLSGKELYIFDHRLLSEESETLNKIGEYYGISRERIRQIEARLLKKLKKYFREEVPELADFTFETPRK